jgi:lipoprotein-releasing system permease protein
MFNAFERTVAFRYLRARKGERFVSIIALFSLVGITLGVATLIIVTSVMNGFRQDLMNRIIGLNGHLTVQPERGRALEGHEAILARLGTIGGIAQAPRWWKARCRDPGGRCGGRAMRGLRPADPPRQPAKCRHAARCRRGLRRGRMQCAGAARPLRVRAGDSLTVLLPQAFAAGFLVRTRQRTLSGREHRRSPACRL